MNDLGWTITSVVLPEIMASGVRTAYQLDSKPLSASRQSLSRITCASTGRERNRRFLWGWRDES